MFLLTLQTVHDKILMTLLVEKIVTERNSFTSWINLFILAMQLYHIL